MVKVGALAGREQVVLENVSVLTVGPRLHMLGVFLV